MPTATTPKTESALLKETVFGWDLCSLKEAEGCRCFGPIRYVCDQLLAQGPRAHCEEQAKLLGYHIDVIEPLL